MKIEQSITFDMQRSVNKLLAVSVPTKQPIQARKSVSGGLSTIANRQRLVGLKVVYAKGDLLAGMTVYFREADIGVHGEFQQVYKLPKLNEDGTPVEDDKNDNPEFVLIPEDRVVVVDLHTENMTVSRITQTPSLTRITDLPPIYPHSPTEFWVPPEHRHFTTPSFPGSEPFHKVEITCKTEPTNG